MNMLIYTARRLITRRYLAPHIHLVSHIRHPDLQQKNAEEAEEFSVREILPYKTIDGKPHYLVK